MERGRPKRTFPINPAFGNFIKKIRLENGLSIRALAKELGVTATTLQNWERGVSYPQDYRLISIAETLKIDYQFLKSLLMK